MDEEDIRQLLLDLDDEYGDDGPGDGEEIGTAFSGVYDTMGKAELVRSVLDRQQVGMPVPRNCLLIAVAFIS